MIRYRVYFIYTVAVLILILLPALSSSTNGKSTKAKFLPAKHTQKIKQIAGFIANELTVKNIKTATVKPFSDFKGKQTEESKLMTKEFSSHLSSAHKNLTVITGDGADAVITGILMPFKGKQKWRLQIKAVRADTGEIITSYMGYFKEPTK